MKLLGYDEENKSLSQRVLCWLPYNKRIIDGVQQLWGIISSELKSRCTQGEWDRICKYIDIWSCYYNNHIFCYKKSIVGDKALTMLSIENHVGEFNNMSNLKCKLTRKDSQSRYTKPEDRY